MLKTYEVKKQIENSYVSRVTGGEETWLSHWIEAL